MHKRKSIKSLTSVIFLLLALWIAVPKVYIHDLFHHVHQLVKVDDQTRVQSDQSSDDCEFDKYNKPVYFHIFTFISKLAPVKPKNSQGPSGQNLMLSSASVLVQLLRAPPATE